MEIVEKRVGSAKTYDKFLAKLSAMMESLGLSENKAVFSDVHGYHSYQDPTRPELTIHTFLVNLRNYPLNLVNDAKHNCRTEGLKLKKIHTDLKKDISENNTHLSLNHNGITVSTDGTVSHRAGVVTVDGEVFIRNGGHSNRIFQELAVEEALPKNQFIKVEIVEGKLSRSQSVSFSIGRNTGEKLKQHSPLNLAGKLKWIQDLCEPTFFGHRIAWEEGQEDGMHPIHGSRIIQVLDMANASKYSSDDFPSDSQLQPNNLLVRYSENIDEFKAMAPIAVDMLMLEDGIGEIMIETIQAKLGKNFKELLLSTAGKKNIGNKDSKAKNQCRYKMFLSTKMQGDFFSPYTGKVRAARVNEGGSSPIISSARVFQQVRSGHVSWKGGLGINNILAVYRQVMPSIIEMAIKNSAMNAPEDVASNKGFWAAVYNKVDATFARQK